MAHASESVVGAVIAADQPTIFPTAVRVGISSIIDGSMKDGTELMTPSATRNRERFLREMALPVAQTTTFIATFGGDDYCRYVLATPGIHQGFDGLATDQVNQPLLLPLADCTGAVFYDPAHHALMLSHLGRHSTEQFGAEESVQYLHEQFGSDPAQLLVWLSPSPNGTDYPLWAFVNRSFREVLREQLLKAGVTPDHLEASTVDTIQSADYFSHSEFLKGHRDQDGRYAIVAMLT